MDSKRNVKVWLAVPGVALLLSGCGGFSASPSISPASFFMPGLIKAAPRQEHPPVYVASQLSAEPPAPAP